MNIFNLLYLLTSCRKRKMRQKDEERDKQFLKCSYLSGFSPPGFRAKVVQVCLRKEELVGDWLFFFLPVELKSDITWNENVWHQEDSII